MNTKLTNGELWYDTEGNILHAHGGHMLKWGDNWYWYGENRTENRYVSVYTVSYTHLDVYKRQGLRRAARRITGVPASAAPPGKRMKKAGNIIFIFFL